MNEFGQLAVLIDGNDDYFYYYQLDEERLVRVTEDGEARINAYWDGDILTEDMIWLTINRGVEIEYMDADLVEVYLSDPDYKEIFEDEHCKDQIFKMLYNYKIRRARNDTTRVLK